jgi:hypothetical protein
MFLTVYLTINPSSQTLVMTRSEVPLTGGVTGDVGGVDVAGVSVVAGFPLGAGTVLQADVSARVRTTNSARNEYSRKCFMVDKPSYLFGYQ